MITVKAIKPGPGIADLVQNFAGAIGRWASAGFPVVSEEVFQARLAECRRCDFWDEVARLGLGECNHQNCGCTRFKLWVQTEICPLGNWK